MIEAVIADEDIKSVGIIATKTTIASGIYQEKFSRRKPQLLFHPLATPLLASMIEEGFYNDNISSAVLEEYLSHESFKSIDGLVLACTHYPLIKKEIDYFFKSKVKLFDSAEVVASKLKKILEAESLKKILEAESLINSERKDPNRFYVSDFTQSFEHSTKIFFGKQVKLELMNLWK